MRRSYLRQILGILIFVGSVGGCSNNGPSGGSQSAPVIAQQPLSATITIGQTATFTVSATSDSSVTYQWQKNGTNISGATSASYTTPATASGDSRAKFDVVVTNQYGSATSAMVTLTVNPAATLQSIAVTPASPSISVAGTQQFTATGTYSDSSTKNITASVTWASSKTGIATIGASTGLLTGVAAGATQITATLGSVVSPNDALTVTTAVSNPSDVPTYHNDNMRTGVNAHETILTTANVNSTTFGKLGEFTVDGQIDGQILYLNQVNIPGHGTKNVIYAATEMDSVYAFDADSVSGNTSTFLWKVSLVPSGEAPVAASSLPCGNLPFNGVTATPVIDRGRNAIYLVAMTQDSVKNIVHRIHALDLTTGSELFGGPTVITATYPGTGGNSQNGVVTFLPLVHHDRAALLESGGVIYTAWSGYYGDCGSYSAWVIAYNADTLAPTGAIDLVPDNSRGGMWMGGGGPAADAAGNVYVITGNGLNDTPGTNQSFGDSFVKLSNVGSLSVADYFTPQNAINLDNADLDFGSSGPLLLPDLVDGSNITQHLAIGAGKDGYMYVVSRDNMGQFNAMANEIHQQIKIAGNENHSSAVYFNGTVYVGPVFTPLEAYTMTQTMLPTAPTSVSAHTFGSNGVSNGTVPSISANGTTNGIVWLVDSVYQCGSLFALNANDLANGLYDSTQAAGNRDKPSSVSGHFITPTISNGKVFFGTGSTVAVYGLLGP
jgi:hypothetical protein